MKLSELTETPQTTADHQTDDFNVFLSAEFQIWLIIIKKMLMKQFWKSFYKSVNELGSDTN